MVDLLLATFWRLSAAIICSYHLGSLICIYLILSIELKGSRNSVICVIIKNQMLILTVISFFPLLYCT
jgi:hypothetical protein